MVIQKIADETGISLKLVISIIGMLILFGSTWAQISVKMADLSSELRFMNAQMIVLINQSEAKLQGQVDQLKTEQWTRREMYSLQVQSERALNDAGLKVILPKNGD